MPNTWVVIPTYNEKDNVENMVRALFSQNITDLHVLVVDDNSPDKTADIVKNLQSNFPNLHLLLRENKAGLGPAYIAGFTHAIENGAQQIVQMDADFSHDPADVKKLIASLKNHDLVLGSRYKKGISVINWPLKRLLISIGGNVYASLITGMPFKDTTGGFKAWKADTLEDINFKTIEADGYAFQIITTFRAWKQKKQITEVPIIFTERREGQSKMSGSIIHEAIWVPWKLRLGL